MKRKSLVSIELNKVGIELSLKKYKVTLKYILLFKRGKN